MAQWRRRARQHVASARMAAVDLSEDEWQRSRRHVQAFLPDAKHVLRDGYQAGAIVNVARSLDRSPSISYLAYIEPGRGEFATLPSPRSTRTGISARHPARPASHPDIYFSLAEHYPRRKDHNQAYACIALRDRPLHRQMGTGFGRPCCAVSRLDEAAMERHLLVSMAASRGS